MCGTVFSSRSISLIGMPGVGKSTVGRHLARRVGAEFTDTDAWIEQRIGCSIRAFFEQHGEARFREIETEVLREALTSENGVIATGGGVVLSQENRRLLRSRTVCVYLRATPEDLFKRLRHDSKRPLLQVEDPLSRLRDLYATRDPLYREASHYALDSARGSFANLLGRVLMQLEMSGVISQ